MTPFISILAGTLLLTNTLQLVTNSSSGTTTNQDCIFGQTSTLNFIVTGTVQDNNGNTVSQITQTGIYAVISPDGWGYQVNIVLQTNNTGLVQFTPGSLAYQTVTNLQARSNTFANLSAFTVLDPAHTNFVPNPNFWLSFAPQRTASVVAQGNPLPNNLGIGGSAVSPRHVINCGHAPFTLGTMLAFVDINGTAVIRQVVASTNTTVPPQFTNGDINVALLNSDLPATVFPYPVMPTNYLAYLPCLTNNNGSTALVQILGENQQKQFFPKIWQDDSPSVLAVSSSLWLGTALNINIVVGDSGHPIMMPVGTNLVLFGHWSTTMLSEANYGDYYNRINSMMHFLSTNNNLFSDYQLTPADFSAFRTFP
jgi:hypothetical protein